MNSNAPPSATNSSAASEDCAPPASGSTGPTGDGEVVALDAGQGTVLWSEPFGDVGVEPPVTVDEGADFFVHGATGMIERREPHDGSVVWQAHVGRSGQIDVAVHGDVAYAATSTAVIALPRHGRTALVDTTHSRLSCPAMAGES